MIKIDGREINNFDFGWIVALLEGEGTFTKSTKTPVIKLDMKDKDTVDKAAKILCGNGSVRQVKGRLPTHSTMYEYTVTGYLAIEWMQSLYPYMKERRQKRIKELIYEWTDRKSKCINGHDRSMHSYRNKYGIVICKLCRCINEIKRRENKEKLYNKEHEHVRSNW